MQTTEPTPELKQMNRYWYMLAATLNELGMALNHGDHTPEERLALIRAIYDHMQGHMPPAAPPSVGAEAQAHAAERTREREAGTNEQARAIKAREAEVAATGQMLTYRIGPDGMFHEHVFTPDPNEGPLTDEEVRIMLREG